MPRRIFVAATGQHCGKTTASLLLMQAAQKLFGRVGFIKPVGQEYREVDGLKVDKDALLMAEVFNLFPHLEFMSPVVADRSFTRRYIDGELRREDLVDKVLSSYRQLEKSFDAIVIEGTGHSGVGSVFGLNNAYVAKLLDAPVAMVTGGGIGQVVDLVHLAMPLYRQEGASFRALIANKLVPDKRTQSLSYLGRAFAGEGIRVVGGLNYAPSLANPSFRSISKHLKLPLRGDANGYDRLINEFQLGVASSQRVVDLLDQDTLVITASTRDELLVTLSSLYDIPEYKRKIVGIIICGTVPVSPITQRILDASGVPHLRTELTSTAVNAKLRDFVAKLSAEDKTKLDWLFDSGAQEILEQDFNALFSSSD